MMTEPTSQRPRRSFGFTPGRLSGPQLVPEPGEPEAALLPPDAVVDLYTVDELEQIAALMCEQLGYSLSADARVALRRYLHRRIHQPWFAYARSVRNAMERARLRHARRLLTNANPRADRAALTTIEAPDLLASRVFDDAQTTAEAL